MSECNCCCCQRVKHDSSLPLYHHIEIPKPPAAATTSISTIDPQTSTNADVPSESNTTEKNKDGEEDKDDKRDKRDKRDKDDKGDKHDKPTCIVHLIILLILFTLPFLLVTLINC